MKAVPAPSPAPGAPAVVTPGGWPRVPLVLETQRLSDLGPMGAGSVIVVDEMHVIGGASRADVARLLDLRVDDPERDARQMADVFVLLEPRLTAERAREAVDIGLRIGEVQQYVNEGRWPDPQTIIALRALQHRT